MGTYADTARDSVLARQVLRDCFVLFESADSEADTQTAHARDRDREARREGGWRGVRLRALLTLSPFLSFGFVVCVSRISLPVTLIKYTL